MSIIRKKHVRVHAAGDFACYERTNDFAVYDRAGNIVAVIPRPRVDMTPGQRDRTQALRYANVITDALAAALV